MKVKVPAKTGGKLQVYDLISLEEAVFDEGGCWVFFNWLIPKAEEEADPKKKKPAPAKGQVVDEPKSVYAWAWIDLSGFWDPGAKEIV